MRMLRNWKPCTLLAVNSPVTVENSLVAPEKVKNRITIWFHNSTPGCIYPIIENIYFHMYIHVYSSKWMMETTQVSTDGWMDKKIIVYTLQWNIIHNKRNEIHDTMWMNKAWIDIPYLSWMGRVNVSKISIFPKLIPEI